MATINLLYKREIPINEKIKIVIPLVGEVIEQEDDYYSLISMLTAMPIDMMLPLEKAGIDFTTISAYEMFLIFFRGMVEMDTSLVFGDLDLRAFRPAINEDNQSLSLVDPVNDIVINKAIYNKIAVTLRKLHNLKKDNRKPGNKEAKEYMLERARVKAERNSKRSRDSQLESLIVSMVNTEQFKYDYESVLGLTIYQFNESVHQIVNKVAFDNRMIGVYAGTVNAKELSQDDLNWLKHQ